MLGETAAHCAVWWLPLFLDVHISRVNLHIIGEDFLKHFKLLVDVTTGLVPQHDWRPVDNIAVAVLPTTTLSLPTVEVTSSTSLPTVEAQGLGPPAAQQDLPVPPASAAKQGAFSSAQPLSK